MPYWLCNFPVMVVPPLRMISVKTFVLPRCVMWKNIWRPELKGGFCTIFHSAFTRWFFIHKHCVSIVPKCILVPSMCSLLCLLLFSLNAVCLCLSCAGAACGHYTTYSAFQWYLSLEPRCLVSLRFDTICRFCWSLKTFYHSQRMWCSTLFHELPLLVGQTCLRNRVSNDSNEMQRGPFLFTVEVNQSFPWLSLASEDYRNEFFFSFVII